MNEADIFTQADAIRRRRELLAASRQASDAAQIRGDFGQSLGQVLAKLGTAWITAKGNSKLDAESSANQGAYQDALGSAMRDYLGTYQGQPEVPEVPPEVGQGPGYPARPGNPREAIAKAMTSRFPEMQAVGKAGIGEFMAEQAAARKEAAKPPPPAVDFEALLKNDAFSRSGRAKLAQALYSRDTQAVAAAMAALQAERKPVVVNNQLVDPDATGGPSVIMDARDRFTPVGAVGQGKTGPIYGQENPATGEVKFAPQGTNVTVDASTKAGDSFSKTLGEDRAKRITASYDKAKLAANAMQSLEAAEDDFNAGIKSGAPAEIALGLAKWAKALGLDADPSIANTESFRANMAQQTFSLIQNLGSGTAISNADLKFAEQAAGNKITLDDQTMWRLLNIGKAAAANTILSHKFLLQSNMSASGAVPADLETYTVPFNMRGSDALEYNPQRRMFQTKQGPRAQPAPGKPAAASTPATPKVLSVEEWLNMTSPRR